MSRTDHKSTTRALRQHLTEWDQGNREYRHISGVHLMRSWPKYKVKERRKARRREKQWSTYSSD